MVELQEAAVEDARATGGVFQAEVEVLPRAEEGGWVSVCVFLRMCVLVIVSFFSLSVSM